MAMWNWRPAERPGHTAPAGFTLLEVVVALAIVALALVALLRLHLLSLESTMRAQDLTTAVQLAQSRMAELGPFPEPGEERGRFDTPEFAKFYWQTAVTEHKLEATESEQTNLELRHIEVTIRWGDGLNERSYTLEAYASQHTPP
jgi:general secretion pathway protein I